jgi:type II secretory ATPase GspE/PulE/Tfp pilus assembly ATPase PilB-like protein
MESVCRSGNLLLQRGLVGKRELIAALGEVSTIPYIDCMRVEVDAGALKLIPYEMAKRCNALPLGIQEASLVVAMAEPQNLHTLDELSFRAGMKISPRLAFRSELSRAIDKHYGVTAPEGSSLAIPQPSSLETEGMEFISFSDQKRNIEAMREMEAELLQKSKTTPAVQVVASTIRAAEAKKASDIHIEPQSGETSIRLRVDGVLREYQRIPRALQNPVTSRIKILSDMNIAERRAPQDGRFLVKIGGQRIDIRVSSLPTQYGEKVVMRLLETDAPAKEFSELGIPE